MSKNTHGKWTKDVSGGHHVVVLEDDRIAAFCGAVGAEDDEESQANARLIAAAPELLEALQVMVSVFFDASGSHGMIEDSAMIRAYEAISKATGEQS